MKFRTVGLIIKEQAIGEQDRLVHTLTESNGVIKAFVRGAKNAKNPKCVGTSLLSCSRLTVYEGRDSYIIGEALPLHIFGKLRDDIKKMCLAQYFCELALTVCPREQPAESFLKLILNALYLLSENKRPPQLIKPCVEMRLSAAAGYMPNLTMCAVCGKYSARDMLFLPKSGTIECKACHLHPEDIHIQLNASSLTALRHTVYADDQKLFSFTMPDEDFAALNAASENYLKFIFERDFPTLSFYNQCN